MLYVVQNVLFAERSGDLVLEVNLWQNRGAKERGDAPVVETFAFVSLSAKGSRIVRKVERGKTWLMTSAGEWVIEDSWPEGEEPTWRRESIEMPVREEVVSAIERHGDYLDETGWPVHGKRHDFRERRQTLTRHDKKDLGKLLGDLKGKERETKRSLR